MILHLYGHDRLYDLQSMATAFFPDRGFGPDGMETASRAYEENGQLVCETVIECEGRTARRGHRRRPMRPMRPGPL